MDPNDQWWFKKVEIANRIDTKSADLEKSHQRNLIQSMDVNWMQNENNDDGDHDGFCVHSC